MEKRIGLLTGGGDAPGQNVCLKAVLFDAIDRGYEVIGIRKGWEGLLHYQPENRATHGENVMLLTKIRVRDIDRMPGSFLHSSRLNPGQVGPEAVPMFLRRAGDGDQPVDLTVHLKRVVETLELDALLVLGDRATLTYASRLSGEGVPLVGIPKTVHNDVHGSDYALGFSTALGRGVRFVHEVRAMAGSREEIGVIEIFGRTSGLTTLVISLLAGADRSLIPEVPFDPEKLAALLIQDKGMNPNNYAILVMSEATSIEAGKVDRYGDILVRSSRLRRQERGVPGVALAGTRTMGAEVSGSGDEVTEILEHLTGQRLLFQPLSYLIRTGEPDGQDLLGAMNFAMMSVSLLADGKTGRLAAYRQRENYVDLPLETVTEAVGNMDVAKFYDAARYYPRTAILWAARV